MNIEELISGYELQAICGAEKAIKEIGLKYDLEPIAYAAYCKGVNDLARIIVKETLDKESEVIAVLS